MKYFHATKQEDIEIPSLQERSDGEAVRVSNIEDMDLLVQAMGFESIDDFNRECSTPAEELIGKFFTITGKANGRLEKQPVFIMDEESVQ